MKYLKNQCITGIIFLIVVALINLSCTKTTEEENEIIEPNMLNCIDNHYPDCTIPNDIPLLFCSGVVSTQYADFGISFLPDLSEIYFTRRGASSNSNLGIIMQMKKVNGIWTEPQVAPFSGTYNEMEPLITPDGSKLIFGSNRPLEEGGSPGTFLQWVVERTEYGWSEPRILGDPFINRFVMYPTVANNGNLYFTGEDGIYVSEMQDGNYQEPVKLGDEINALTRAAHPCIAPDESYLIFDAQPRGNLKSDLFISLRKQDGSWSTAVKLNENINSAESQAIAMISPDKKYMFFVRNGEIYWVSTALIPGI